MNDKELEIELNDVTDSVWETILSRTFAETTPLTNIDLVPNQAAEAVFVIDVDDTTIDLDDTDTEDILPESYPADTEESDEELDDEIPDLTDDDTIELNDSF